MARAVRWVLVLCAMLSFVGAVAPRIGSVHTNGPMRPIVRAAEPHAEPAYKLPPDKLAKARALGRIRNILHFGDGLWDIVLLWLLLVTRAAARLEAWAEGIARQRWIQGLVFFAVLIVAIGVADLPLDVYAHQVSRGYGISVQGWGSWLLDCTKALGLSLLIGAPVLLLFNWIVRVRPRRYWIWCWMPAVVLMIAGTFVEPLLEPIFNEYEPLAKSNPALVAQLEEVVAHTGIRIPPERMVLMKASLKTNGLNAYVSGLGATRQVVVWDTTAGRIPNDEVLFILGHESGHYVLNHIPKELAGSSVGLFFLFWSCAGLAGYFGARRGLDQAVLSSRAGFVALLLTVSAASFVAEPVGNAFSRHFEHEADVYGQEAIHGIVPDPQKTAVSSFNHLGETWLEEPDPSWFIEFWTYSHPSIEKRAEFAAHYDPWAQGGRGRFFEK